MENHPEDKIKEYKYWDVYIAKNQNYLGRCYVWCKREDALELPDATEEEQKELFIILREMEQVLIKAFGANMLNYAFLGNVAHHLHGHIIPRYLKPVEFGGQVFEDDRWGHNYLTDRNFTVPQEVFEQIKSRIKSFLK